MKRLRDLARAAGDAALQLTLPLFDQIAPVPVRAPASRPVPPATTEGGTGSDSYTPDIGTGEDVTSSKITGTSRLGLVRLA